MRVWDCSNDVRIARVRVLFEVLMPRQRRVPDCADSAVSGPLRRATPGWRVDKPVILGTESGTGKPVPLIRVRATTKPTASLVDVATAHNKRYRICSGRTHSRGKAPAQPPKTDGRCRRQVLVNGSGGARAGLCRGGTSCRDDAKRVLARTRSGIRVADGGALLADAGGVSRE